MPQGNKKQRKIFIFVSQHNELYPHVIGLYITDFNLQLLQNFTVAILFS